jgi:hypothetical protein
MGLSSVILVILSLSLSYFLSYRVTLKVPIVSPMKALKTRIPDLVLKPPSNFANKKKIISRSAEM